MYKTYIEKIKMFVIWLHFGNIIADNVDQVYTAYSGTTESTSALLVNCIKETLPDSIGMSINPVNGVYSTLDISW